MQQLLRFLGLLLVSAALFRPGGARAQGTAFSCDGSLYQIRQVNSTSYLYKVNRSTATYTTSPVLVNNGSNDLGVLLNGLAYNAQDGYMYALTTPGATGSNANAPVYLYRIGQNSITQVGGAITLSGTNLAITLASGTFDKVGNYYFSSQNTGGTADYSIYRLSPGSTTPTAATRLTPSQNVTLYDLAFNPSDGLIYGVNFVGGLYQFNQNNNTLTVISNPPNTNLTAALAVGTASFDVAGNLYAYSNGTVGTANSSNFYQVNLTTGAYTQISTIDPASVSDGASCINPGNAIDVTKEATNVKLVNASTYDISYAIRVRNTYTATLTNVQVSDLLKGNVTTSTNVPFPTATALTIVAAPVVTNYDGATLAANPAYTGLSATPSGSAVGGGSLLSGTQSLTAGQRALITYTVRVQFASAGAVPTTARNNTAYATSTSGGPNQGYILTSNDVLLTPNELIANDASTNSADFAALRTTTTNGTPDATDAPVPTPVTFAPSISGTVFEDVSYGGGLGRDQGMSQGIGRPNALVELYSGSGATATFVTSMLTAADGSYAFTGLSAGSSYVVRVVNSTVTSSRNTGGASNLVAVQTYRANADATNGTVPDPNRVGGEYPGRTDAGNGSSTLGALYVNVGTLTAPESISAVTLNTNTPAVNVDFGYNFDTVVNTNDAGQGSLRQFIVNANALDNTNLDQDQASTGGPNPAQGVETSIFMVPDGNVHDGLTAYSATTNPGLATQLTNGVAVITPATALPALGGTYGASTSLDGTTQTQNVGNTNNVSLGTGGSVGTTGTALSQVNGPEVQLTGKASLPLGLDIASTATNTTLKGLAIYGFGNATNDDNNALIRSNAAGLTITQSVLGSAATAFSAPTTTNTTTTNANALNIVNNNGGSVTISNNLIGFANGKGIAVGPGVTGASISNNEVRGNDQGNGYLAGLDIQGNGARVSGNLLAGNAGEGISSNNSTGGNVLTGNTVSGNGVGTATASAVATSGIYVFGANNSLSQNVVANNYGAGIMVSNAASTTTISQNSVYGNGTITSASSAAASGDIGIDLQTSAQTSAKGDAPYVTLNSTATGGANALTNYPVITSAAVVGSNLVVQGYAKAGATIELFMAQANASALNATGANFGQGKTYLTTVVEGSTADTDARTGLSYSGAINGFNQGADPNANGFSFSIPLSSLPGGTLALGTLLTATATVGGATSEFSGNVRTAQPPVPNDVTNASIPDNTTTPVALNPSLSGTALGLTGDVTTNTANTIKYYTIASLPTSGTLYYNGTALTAATLATTQVGDPSKLTFKPVYGSTNTVTFTYTATDANGLVSTTHNTSGTASSGPATYTIPVMAAADVTASLSGGTTLTMGQPTGYYTATFTNEGPDAASSVTQVVTLPAGATLTTTQQNALTTTYSGSSVATSGGVTTITFPTATTLANGVANSYRFAFTAPATPGTSTLTASTSTGSSEGPNAAPNAASLTMTTNALVDVQATLGASAATVAPGATATFTATFTNNTAQPAPGVTATVQLLPGLTPTSVSGQAGTTAGTTVTYGTVATLNTTTGLLTYTLTTLGASASTSSAIAFAMPTSGVVVGTASVATTTTETNLTNNAASASIAAGPSFDLATTLYGPSSVVAGSPVTFSVSTTNNGPQAVSGAVQTVTLPTGLTASGSGQNVFISNNGSYNSSTGVVTFPALGTLPAGQMVGNTITFTSPSASFAPSASVTPNTTAAGETNTANNVAYLNGAASSVTLTPAVATGPAANVYAILSTTSAIVTAGTQVTYTTGVGNAGPGTASGVAGQLQLLPGLATSTLTVGGQTGTVAGATTTFPSGADYRSVSYNTQTGLLSYSATASPLASGASVSFPVVVTVPATVGNNGQLLATNSVGSTTPDNVPADNVKAVAIAVQPGTELVATLVGPTAGVTPGQPVTYTATFTNNGPDAASVVAETVQLPTGLTASSLTVGGQTGTLSNGVISFASGATYTVATGLVTLPALATDAVGAVQSFSLSFAAPTQSYVVSSAISGATPEANLANNAASVATAVTPTADVAVAVSGPATAAAGNPVTYTVAVTNNGPSTATSVVPTLQLPTGLTITASGPGTPTYSAATGLLTFPTIASLPVGVTLEYYATLAMPSPASGQLTPLAAVSAGSADNVASNNTAALTTSLAPATATTADLLTTIMLTSPTGAPTTVAAGTALNYTIAYRNQGAATGAGVTATATLPTGLGAGLLVGNVAGTYSTNTGLYTYASGPAAGATYDPATGVLTFPIGTLAPSTTANSYTVAFAAPSTGPLVVVSSISSLTAESDVTNNRANSNLTITPTSDLAANLVGPAAALPGVPNVYTATFSNVGLSPAANVTPTVQLPTGLTTATLLAAGQAGTVAGSTITFPNGASYSTTSGLLTFPALSSLAPGPNGAVSQSFTVTMPATGSLTATASYTAASIPSSDTNTANNSKALTTQNAPLSLAPTAENIVNSLQSARGNTSTTNLAISPLYATDPGTGGGITSYYVQSLPTSGTLYYNGTAITAIPTNGYPAANPALLSYKPASGFVGNAFFTYSATDNSGVTSNTALYTIAVAQDQSTTYTTYNAGKGSTNPYATGDVLAQVTDPNMARYTSAGIVYDAATGVQQMNTSNGLPTTGTNATLVSGTLPAGVGLDPATGRIYVSDRTQLVNNATARAYTVMVQTVDLNGGVNMVPVTFTLGAYPLPVELVKFDAQALQNRDALLSWTTASELNNDHFEVERSLDGSNFAKVGQVAGQGNKATATAYAFTEAGIGPKVAAGQPVYYRLRQVDADGQASYSPVRSVRFTGPVALALSLYPNPASASTSLDLSALPAAGTYQVLLLDATGRQVRQLTLGGGLLQSLTLGDLATGTYQVLVSGQRADGSALRQVLRLTKE